MDNDTIISEIRRFESEIAVILSRFNRSQDSCHIAEGDELLLRQRVREIVDLFNDALGPNNYSQQIINDFNQGITNWIGSPSYKSVENIISVVRAALTRFTRNPQLLSKKKAEENLRRRENVFIIHGQDEAKWRELKDILMTQFRLNPIVLLEQPDVGCKTIIEKFEHYAPICNYAIAVFTPDDEVTFDGKTYLQPRPNVIYELGWFSAKLSRNGVMLLLKEGTSIFSDFGGIIQKRFTQNISERILEIKSDLVAVGILDNV